MGVVTEEIILKNRALNRLNRTSSNVYNLQTMGVNEIGYVAKEKLAASNPGDMPEGFWADGLKITNKDWKIVGLAVLITSLAFFILIKTKIFKF